MYCIIQEIDKKREQKGFPKTLESRYMNMSINGEDKSHYYYSYSEERFDRLKKKAYRVSIHESFRVEGKVRKKQFVIFTVDYYDIATGQFNIWDWGDKKIEVAANVIRCDKKAIYELIEKNLEALIQQIQDEFHETEEYKQHQEHERIVTEYIANKINFKEKYRVSDEVYDQCYDVFGNLKNEERLKKIVEDYEARMNQEESSYYKEKSDNYSSNGYNDSCYNHMTHNYNEEEKQILKSFYRMLSKKFHPDANPGEDTSKQMQLLNELKKSWGV